MSSISEKNKIFIEKCRLKHGDEYDYSLVDYINSKTKVKIICKKHGVFEQRASNHVSGIKCPSCSHSKPKNTES